MFELVVVEGGEEVFEMRVRRNSFCFECFEPLLGNKKAQLVQEHLICFSAKFKFQRVQEHDSTAAAAAAAEAAAVAAAAAAAAAASSNLRRAAATTKQCQKKVQVSAKSCI